MYSKRVSNVPSSLRKCNLKRKENIKKKLNNELPQPIYLMQHQEVKLKRPLTALVQHDIQQE